jgi:hypothetical protein
MTDFDEHNNRYVIHQEEAITSIEKGDLLPNHITTAHA